MDLQADELELILKACRKYRSTLPSYLLSARHEMEIADAVIQRLDEMRQRASVDD